jgi:hypothetical protein
MRTPGVPTSEDVGHPRGPPKPRRRSRAHEHQREPPQRRPLRHAATSSPAERPCARVAFRRLKTSGTHAIRRSRAVDPALTSTGGSRRSGDRFDTSRPLSRSPRKHQREPPQRRPLHHDRANTRGSEEFGAAFSGAEDSRDRSNAVPKTVATALTITVQAPEGAAAAATAQTRPRKHQRERRIRRRVQRCRRQSRPLKFSRPGQGSP